MSEMMRNKGIIKEVGHGHALEDVINQLIVDGELTQNDVDINDGEYTYIESEKYELIDGRLFDVSGAPDEYDTDEEVNEAVRLNDTDYRIHAYYYNGGANLAEMLETSIPQADLAYAPKTSKEIIKEALAKAHVDELEAMLIVTEIFDEEKKAQNG